MLSPPKPRRDCGDLGRESSESWAELSSSERFPHPVNLALFRQLAFLRSPHHPASLPKGEHRRVLIDLSTPPTISPPGEFFEYPANNDHCRSFQNLRTHLSGQASHAESGRGREPHPGRQSWWAATPTSWRQSPPSSAACPGPPIWIPPWPTPNTESISTRRPRT